MTVRVPPSCSEHAATSPARRRFLQQGALGALTLAAVPDWARALPAGAASGAASRADPPLRPFDLHQIRLRPGPLFDALQVNRRWLMALDPDRLLHNFRQNAGLPSSALPLGGWEAPNNELRGHFTGHYLSACALLAAQTGDAAVQARGDAIVAGLATCQAALGNGYLSAFPEELFDRLRAGKPAWAPFYTLHKIMAGLLDAHQLSGNAQALQVLEGMARWVAAWVQPLGDEHMARVLEREYGGMNEVLYNLAAATGSERWQDLARRFDHERVFAPLAAGRDELQGLHANTTIPKIIGAARGYEITGDQRLHDVAHYFWHTVTERRCYCTGGTSNGESWNSPPDVLAKELSGYTQESCVTYNLQKLTRHIYAWSGDPRAFDYYERALYNGILGVQHPADGDKLYYLPLQSGYWKLFGTPLQDFWCCTGSMAESFAKLGDSIYFHDERSLHVNLFVASELDWRERGIRLVQETRFPEDDRIQLTFHCAKPSALALRIRVPGWCEGGNARLNGRPIEAFASAGSQLVLDRLWKDGDRVELQLPMRLRREALPDDASIQALTYGPIVLAGRLGSAGLDAATLRAEPTKPRTVPEYKGEPVGVPAIEETRGELASWVEPVPGRPLEFRTIGQAANLQLLPLNRVFDERFVVYWKLQARN